MIGRLTGTLQQKTPPTLLIDVHGVGYEVDVPMSTLYGLPAVGEQVSLQIHSVYREDAQLLYGFQTEAERSAFRQLIKISGVGPRIGLAVLSGLSVDQLALAVSQQDAAQLTRVPGIGKKTAERLVLELKGKLGSAELGLGAGLGAAPAETLAALLALGYSEKEASAAVRGLPPEASVEEAIRSALKQLAR